MPALHGLVPRKNNLSFFWGACAMKQQYFDNIANMETKANFKITTSLQ